MTKRFFWDFHILRNCEVYNVHHCFCLRYLVLTFPYRENQHSTSTTAEWNILHFCCCWEEMCCGVGHAQLDKQLHVNAAFMGLDWLCNLHSLFWSYFTILLHMVRAKLIALGYTRSTKLTATFGVASWKSGHFSPTGTRGGKKAYSSTQTPIA